jgi:hypothetical protein
MTNSTANSTADSTAGATAGTTALQFQAPPAPPEGEYVDEAVAPPRELRSGVAAPPAPGRGELRMLRGARQAAAGMKISDAQIRAVLEDPQQVQPDPKQPHRTRLSRKGITVTTGNDGMILRVTRRG